MIDPATIQKIKDTADIVDVVSDYVHLTRRGANFMGLCPFHNERTPSFSVSKSKNFCYCFSCHKGGSPVSFIMEKEGVSYHEALLQLARKYGIEVKERELTDEERKQQTRKEGMLVANDWAKDYFVSNLNDKEEGKNIGLTYLYKRKVTPEAIKAFYLGYAIDKGTDFTDAALKKGFSLDILKATGLTGSNQQGGNYDKFRGRVIFPIVNTAGKTVAFGGRDLKGSPAKYINSPESEVYSKSKELYGIFQAKGEMVRENKVYLVEGYLDVIGFWQSGIKNVVASSGTALTDGQIALIHRFTDNVTLIYDGDAAGIKASLRGIDMLLAHNLNVKAVPLPPGDDPDSLAAKLTPEELKNYLKENEIDIIRFKIKVLMDDAANDPQKKWVAIRSIVESISQIPDKIKRDVYIQECSLLLDIKETTLSSEVSKARYQVVENEKMKRRQEQLKKDFPEKESHSDPATTTKNVNAEEKTNINSLYPLEKQLIENCLKYGFHSLWKKDDSSEDNEMTTAIEFIAAELEIDNITFSHSEFYKIFNALLNLLEDFKKDLTDLDKTLEEKNREERKKLQEQIAMKSISVTEIQLEEEKIEEFLENNSLKQRENFSQNYILDKFGSHHDELIRKFTIQTLAEKHKLSSMFSNNPDYQQNKEKIIRNIITSLNVLKNGIIDLQLKTLMDQLKNNPSLDSEKEKEIHEKISDIIKMRSRMAKNIGERIIAPK